MHHFNGVRKAAALLLVSAALFGLCSCGSANRADQPVTQPEQTAALIETTSSQPEQTTPAETTGAETTLAEQTTQSVRTTRPAQPATTAAVFTRAAAGEETEPIAVTGIETLKDGRKTIVYPAALTQSQRRWPVISWANGTGCPTQTYTALLELLASGGYIVVADDSVMTADGTAQIDSLDYILRQNSDPSSVFYRKVDPAALGICGHSQGGRSCINAAQNDSRIRCVVSIAGSSSVEEASGLNTPTLFLTGTADLVVLSSYWCKPSYNAVTGPAAYASLKGGVHTTCMIQPKKVSGYIQAWFDAYLKHDADAAKVFAPNGRLANDPAWRGFQTKN